MIHEIENQKEQVEVFEIENKKYTVITRCIENSQNTDKLYNIFCKYAISKLN